MIVHEIITPRLTSPAEYIDTEHKIHQMYPLNKKIDFIRRHDGSTDNIK